MSSDPVGIDCSQCTHDFDTGTQVILTAVPESGWQLAKWQGDCDANGLVIMGKEKQCEAIFVTIKPDTSGIPILPPSDTNPSIAPAIYSNVPNEVMPQLVVNPGFYNFGHLPAGNLSPAQVITVTNAGHADLQLWLALDTRSRQIVGQWIGQRDAAGASGLWRSLLPGYRQGAVIYTDAWEAYRKVFPIKRHRVVTKKSGKTNHIERFNNTLRQRISRLGRKTLAFSKKLENYIGASWHFILYYNKSLL